MNYRAKIFYKGKVARNYDKERFGSLKGKIYDWFEKQSIGRALNNFPKHHKVLDVPCGTGRITEYIKTLDYDVSGADISVDMLKIASNRSDINYFLRDITTMKFPRGMFNIITCVRLMGHLPFPQKVKALRSMRRVAPYLIVTFYMQKKIIQNWYPITPFEIGMLCALCGLVPVKQYPVCSGWSDGITYVFG